MRKRLILLVLVALVAASLPDILGWVGDKKEIRWPG